MTRAQLTNNAATVLASGISNVATSLTVAAGKGALFPAPSGGNYFYATITESTLVEIVKCTARTTDTFTITRAQDGTSAQTFTSAAAVKLNLTAAVIAELGYLGMPQSIQSSNYTLVLTDAGLHILHPAADTSERTFTIPANASVPYEIGTELNFVNQFGAGILTIGINSDTMRLEGGGTTGARKLLSGGRMNALKITATEWMLSSASIYVAVNSGKAIFGYGSTGTNVSLTNLVSNTGVVATDTAGVGTARQNLAASTYAVDRAIFGYGSTGSNVSLTNLVGNTGVVATDTAGVGTARYRLAAASYGTDKALFGYGETGAAVSLTNLVSNTGVVAADTTGVGTARRVLAAASYGTDKAIFGYGLDGSAVAVSLTNLVSNTGVVATDTTGVGSARYYLSAASYGTDKALFGYGTGNYTNLVSNTGVVATDTTGVGTSRNLLAAASYGTDKAIFGYGTTGSNVSLTNLVGNTGVVATDTAGVGTARQALAAAGF